MKIIILGSTGMLGSAVGHYFLSKYGEEDVCLSHRNKDVGYGANKFYFDALTDGFDVIGECDYVINCIGVIKPFIETDTVSSIHINSVFPWELANYCEKRGCKLIHITTDCVFSGREGNYDENAPHDCLDIYGKSKSLGEPGNCMVLRTSIIGEEIHKKASLIEWAKSQQGKEINGLTNHYWNGVTTKQYAKICEQIISNDWFAKEPYHVFSNTVSKYELLNLINDRFSLDLTINEFEASVAIDRTLATHKDLNDTLNIPPIAQQLKEI